MRGRRQPSDTSEVHKSGIITGWGMHWSRLGRHAVVSGNSGGRRGYPIPRGPMPLAAAPPSLAMSDQQHVREVKGDRGVANWSRSSAKAPSPMGGGSPPFRGVGATLCGAPRTMTVIAEETGSPLPRPCGQGSKPFFSLCGHEFCEVNPREDVMVLQCMLAF